jgi:hypothetical protein
MAKRKQPMHPLSGSNLGTVLPLLVRNGGVRPGRLPQAAMAVLSALGRSPFTAAERVYTARRLRRAPPMPPPVFIVGHWRSGTTHLYNVLSKAGFGFVSPMATGMPWDMLLLGSWLRPMIEKQLPEDRFVDAIPVNPDSPQEDEFALANMIPLSFFHGVYFPKHLWRHFERGVFFEGCSAREVAAWQETFRYLLGKLALAQGNRRLLIKNPVYTARLGMLHEMLPEAKFIHIHRNPYEVFESSRRFFGKMFEQLALQRYDRVDIDDFVLRTYPRLMDRLIADSAGLPADTFVEIRYEDLDADPLGTVEHVYRTLGLDGFAAARPVFEAYVASVRDFPKNPHRFTADREARVAAHWGRFIERWGYAPPPPGPARAAAAGR